MITGARRTACPVFLLAMVMLAGCASFEGHQLPAVDELSSAMLPGTPAPICISLTTYNAQGRGGADKLAGRMEDNLMRTFQEAVYAIRQCVPGKEASVYS